MVANFIGNALGALGNITGSFSTGGGTNMNNSKELMAIQNGYYRSNYQWQNENGWKFLRQGLINADYNPLLAVGTSPQGSWAPTAQATDGTTSMSVDGAASTQANTAQKMSESQIMVNKSSAHKMDEEALTQESVRANNDSQSLLNLLKSDEIRRLLPLKEQKMVADIAVADSIMNLNNVTADWVPYERESGRISANAAMKNAETSATWTPAGIAAGALTGIGVAGLGAIGRLKKFQKLGKTAKLGSNGFSSSKAQYFTTLH